MVKFKKNDTRAVIIAIVVMAIFLVLSLAYVFSLMKSNEEDSLSHLFELAAEKKSAIEYHVESNFQVLRGISMSLAELGLDDYSVLKKLLREINFENSFQLMGLADKSGIIDFYSLDGSVYEDVNLSANVYFLDALYGEEVVSGVFVSEITGQPLSYYMEPVRMGGNVTGVLCAAGNVDEIEGIIGAPVMGDVGFFALISSNGNNVGSTIETEDFSLGSRGNVFSSIEIDGEERQTLRQLLEDRQEGRFTFTAGNDYVGVLAPVDVNDWMILSAIPKSYIDQYFSLTARGTTIIIVSATLIFLLLFFMQRRTWKLSQSSLEYLAYTDVLTGLRNYSKFERDATAILEENPDTGFAVWSVDIKKFKNINSIFGHRTGDLVLKRFGKELSSGGRQSILCRVAADHFVGLRPYRKRDELVEWFEQMVTGLDDRQVISTEQMRMEIAMGFYCTFDFEEMLTIEEMVNRATLARAAALKKAGNNLAFFTEDMNAAIRRQTELTAMSGAALKNGEFTFYLQPKVNIQNGDVIVGAEALARWLTPDGIIPPGDFVPLFEENGFIVELDRYIFRKVCKWYGAYRAGDNPPINIAINISRLGLFREDFIEYYTEQKEKYGIPDGAIELELTESVFSDNYDLFIDVANKLHAAGFICSIDDFGSGYSSLNLLRRLPVDVVKLDAGFFRGNGDVERSKTIIASFISMAGKLNIKTVAEGVELKSQVNFLRENNCDVVQGYVFSRPVDKDSFEKMIRRDGGSLAAQDQQ